MTAALVVLVASPAAPQDEVPQLSFGVVPQQAAAELARGWTPLLEYVGLKCACRLRFETAPDIPTFEARLAAGEYDLAYMNPYHYTVFHRAPGYEAFAKQAGKKIQGIIVVAKDAPYSSVEELAGMTVAFPAPAAFAATVLPKASFRKMGFEVTSTYVSSHDSVYLSVARGLFPAGGGIMRTFNTAPQDVRDLLRILWRTAEYTPHAFAAKPTVAADLLAEIQKSLTSMAESPEGAEILAALGIQALEAAEDSDWDDVRALDINLLQSLEGP
ncbi:MAG: phosphate/phosphite/phosphonate ABC transporter substrate-binding protein [Acidobacteriota bacterium]|nr:phosphate/phosphite/phosphonate ABC transporter substrate-binding protein [Acidobacteriota bacterium]